MPPRPSPTSWLGAFPFSRARNPGLTATSKSSSPTRTGMWSSCARRRKLEILSSTLVQLGEADRQVRARLPECGPHFAELLQSFRYRANGELARLKILRDLFPGQGSRYECSGDAA